ncbi:hypothetical protein NPIL_92571 [Nephila pilipes]|uniref:Uncharacterized protein n=1 Tax=Nephila pilipes TaxID=299642 RepID=A0A8X6PBR7_NEPPI|nr:hypothetical protein NPIL_92571 [Nephila pilipes]
MNSSVDRKNLILGFPWLAKKWAIVKKRALAQEGLDLRAYTTTDSYSRLMRRSASFPGSLRMYSGEFPQKESGHLSFTSQ